MVPAVKPANLAQIEVSFCVDVKMGDELHSSLLKVDAAIASPLEKGTHVKVVEGEASAADDEQELDTAAVAERVRHYLKANQIQWTRFGALVLGVSQGRLSILLGKPKPWHLLSSRVRALYQRMQLWMDTKATFGNNPYMKVKNENAAVKQRVQKVSKAKKEKRRKSLFEASGSYEPVHFKVKDNQELVEEEKAVRELKLMEEQVVIEEVVEEVVVEEVAVEEMVVEGAAEQEVIENVALEEIMLGTSVNLEEVTLEVISIKILVNLDIFAAVLTGAKC